MVRCSLRQFNDHRQGHGTLCCAINKTYFWFLVISLESYLHLALHVYIWLILSLLLIKYFLKLFLRSIHKKCPKVPLVVAGGG